MELTTDGIPGIPSFSSGLTVCACVLLLEKWYIARLEEANFVSQACSEPRTFGLAIGRAPQPSTNGKKQVRDENSSPVKSQDSTAHGEYRGPSTYPTPFVTSTP